MGLEYEQSELEDVLKQSVLEDLVKEKGLDYNVGENGENLSGGQLQRIEIARGLLSQRNIILADEISSALDTVTSQKIFDYLMNSTKTLIEVSHRVSKEQQSQYTKVYNLANLPES
jgi:ABC-type bacteriocin/lantibiotic exporter with double-glycine peptidase domain